MENPNPLGNLTLEQRFSIASFNSTVDRMTEEQSKEMLKELFLQLIRKDNAIKDMAKNMFFG